MALVYCAACPDSLYPHVKMKWAYKSGSLHEIRTLLELEVSKYMADKHDSPTVSCAKVPPPCSTLLSSPTQSPTTMIPSIRCRTTCLWQENTSMSFSLKRTAAMIVAQLATATKLVPTVVHLQLADHLNLEMHLGKDHDLYALFHPPLVIQVSAAADRCTSTAPSHPLHFPLDTGASTSFFDPSVVAKLGWKVRQNAVEHTVWLAGGKPGAVVRDVTGGSFRVCNGKYMVDRVVMKLNSTYDGILGLNFFKHYRLLDHSPLCRLLGHSGDASKVNDIIVPMVTGHTPTPSTAARFLVLRSTKLSVIMPPFTPVHLYATETALYTDVIAKLKSEFAEVFRDKLGDVADFPSITKTKSGV
nr:hypothetical protein I308_06842 [Cryptococcus tetragattii IND107]